MPLRPVALLPVIPFTTDGSGARTIGGWFGVGPERDMALIWAPAPVLRGR